MSSLGGQEGYKLVDLCQEKSQGSKPNSKTLHGTWFDSMMMVIFIKRLALYMSWNETIPEDHATTPDLTFVTSNAIVN